MLLAKEEVVLQSMTERLVEIRICYGMEMSAEKMKAMRISWQIWKMYMLKYIRIAIAKGAFSKKKTLFTSKLDLHLRK